MAAEIIQFPVQRIAGASRPVVERAFQEPSGKIWVLIDRVWWERFLSAARELGD